MVQGAGTDAKNARTRNFEQTLNEEKVMKRIEMIVRPAKLEDVKRTLIEVGVQEMTITRGEGFTWDNARKEFYRGSEYTVDTVPMVTINSVVDDSIVDAVIAAATKTARTGTNGEGRIGDGKIFVHELSGVVRIHTGAIGVEAILRDMG